MFLFHSTACACLSVYLLDHSYHIVRQPMLKRGDHDFLLRGRDSWLLALASSQMTSHLGVLAGSLPREHTFTDQTPAHVFTKNSEYLTNLVDSGGTRALLSLFVGSHVGQQSSKAEPLARSLH